MVPHDQAVMLPPYPETAFLLEDLSPRHQKLFREGKDLFNVRKFWEAHEAWEEVWKEMSDPRKRLVQGLIQAAAAYHLIVTNPRLNGAVRNIGKSLDKLEGMPDLCFGTDIDALRTALHEASAEAGRLGQEDLSNIGERFVVKL